MSASNLLKCARANFHVLANTAAVYGSNYSLELARELWKCSAILAAGQDWEYVRRALSLTKKLGYRYSPEGSTLFKVLTRVHPFFGLWIREKAVRLFKPHLRVNSL